MTRSRKQKSLARTLAASSGISYVKSLYSARTGRFAQVHVAADKHPAFYSTIDYTPLGRQITSDDFCSENCKCAALLPERKKYWEKVFSFLPASRVPELVGMEYVMNKFAQWVEDHPGQSESLYNPLYYATFHYPAGTGYSDYLIHKDRISSAMEGSSIFLVPVGNINDHGEELLSSVGSEGFRIGFMERPKLDYFSSDITTYSVSSLSLFDYEIWSIKKAVRTDAKMYTSESSQYKISRIVFTCDDDVTDFELQKIADIIRSRTGAEWVAIAEDFAHTEHEREYVDNRSTFAMYLCDSPSTDVRDTEFQFAEPQTLASHKLRAVLAGENSAGPIRGAFSSDGITPIGYSDCTVERNADGRIIGVLPIPRKS